MADASIERLVEQVERTRAELEGALGDPDLPSDRVRFAEVSRRYAGLGDAFELAVAYRDAESRVMFIGYNPVHYKLFMWATDANEAHDAHA